MPLSILQPGSKWKFTIDDGHALVLSVNLPALPTDWKLGLPNGVSLDAAGVEAGHGSVSVLNFGDSDPAAGPLTFVAGEGRTKLVISLPDVPSGTCTFHCDLTGSIAQPEMVLLAAYTDSPVGVVLAPLVPTASIGRPFPILMQAIGDGGQLTNVAHTLYAIGPDGRHVQVEMHDDGQYPDQIAGDDEFMGIFTLDETQPQGEWSLVAATTGLTATGQEFVRHSGATFELVQPCVHFLNLATATGIGSDINAEQRAGSIRVRLQIARDDHQPIVGEFMVTATLTAPWDLDGDSVNDTLTASAHITDPLPAQGGNGIVYDVYADVELTVEQAALLNSTMFALVGCTVDMMTPMTVARCHDVKNLSVPIGPFSRSAFGLWDERWVTPPRSFQYLVNQADPDPRYDTLRLAQGVFVRYDGMYRYEAYLYDPCDRLIAVVQAEQQMLGGVSQTLYIDFPGFVIGRNGVDGVYKVKDVRLDGPSEASNPNRWRVHLRNWKLAETQPIAASEWDQYNPLHPSLRREQQRHTRRLRHPQRHIGGCQRRRHPR
ncbi:MAG: hypothetical protein ACREJO_11345 [Phycisphaerales bacterium]